ncbi:autotransporter outer membrane beta-barrel domain-containing protein [Budvicia aquatica]|uniref:AIDA-I autotransporter n=1 Tax=Budvicia aquatica TaxID=82979 RepID=A0A2C6DN23_9GAMM|nr:autotransporter outer membrane beta-barrel domain-containing protein [Budvicia aquatica]PHI30617.1 autotransporter outer membrane beta-barrel domain-containing protein [Budvicia aquatica]VFS50076.1 AIDA-I autotransporter precursor [Budvicia aquatica]
MKPLTNTRFTPLRQDTALIAVFALSVIAMPQSVMAACTSSGTGTYLCENANSTGITITGTDIDINTAPGFSVSEPGNSDAALNIMGSGTVKYTDVNGSTLDTQGGYSLQINNTTTAGESSLTHVQTNANIPNGLFIENSSQNDSTVAIDLSGSLSEGGYDNFAIDVRSSGEKNASVNINTQGISGDNGINTVVHSANGTARQDINLQGDLNVSGVGGYINNASSNGSGILNFSAKNLIALSDVIYISNSGHDGAAITHIDIDGDITSTNGQAASFYNNSYNGLSDLTIRANNVSGQYLGLNITNYSQYGSSQTDIALTGDISATSGHALRLSTYASEGDVGSTIKLNNVSSFYDALYISANATQGDVTSNLDVSGTITSEFGYGIYMMSSVSDGASYSDIKANNITSGYQGLYLSNFATGDVISTISVTGDIVSGSAGGVTIQSSSDQGNVANVINLNNLTSNADGLHIIGSTNIGTSTTDLTVSGQIKSTSSGIVLNSYVDDGNAVANFDINSVTSVYDAIYISNLVPGTDNGKSVVNVTTRGEIVSQDGYGIYTESNSSDTYITVAGLVRGGNDTAVGIYTLDGAQRSATLELQSGYVLEGITQALVMNSNYFDLPSGSLDLPNGHLVLGGAENATFDLSRIDNREEAIFNGDPNRITGFGTLAKTGNGVWTLVGTNTANDAVNLFSSANVEKGVLALDSATLGLAADTALTVANGGALSSIGTSTLSGNLTSSGEIRLANQYVGGNGNFAGDRLTVTGNYTGNSGAYLMIDTMLGDDNSATDRLVINGDSLGTTSVKVNNAGGDGDLTTNGINIINVSGLSSDSTFLLDGDYVTKDGKQAVIGGAYAYTLQANGDAASPDRDWYLSSELRPLEPSPEAGGESRYQPGVPLYEQYPQVLAALNTLPTLQQRIGNRYWSQGTLAESAANNEQWAWGRIEGSHQSSDPARSTSGSQRDIDLWKLQTGIDIPIYQYANGSLLTGGVNFIYGKANADITSYYGDGSIDTSGYGVGATLTWYGIDGVYIDGQLQTMWFDSDLKSDTLSRTMVSGNNGRGYASSIEGGKRYALNEEGLSLTPQMQLLYSRVDFNSFRDPYGSKVSAQDGNNLRTRIGTSLDKETAWVAENGTTSRTHVYGNVDLYNEFTNGTKIKDSGVEFSTRDERQWVGIGAGGTYEWQNGRYAVYGNLNLTSATNNISDNYAVGGAVGIRVGW